MKRTLCFRPYNSKNQLALQTVNGTPVEYAYTPEGWLAGKVLGGSLNPVSTLKYFYAPDGQVTGRSVDGKVQQYRYDAKGQLTAVLDADNKPVETYVYDPAGNILKKTVNGETTTYVYDGANQLVSSETDGILTTRYRYDAAGRLIGEGGKSYRYGWLDKVVSVSEEGQVTATFGYHAGGQLAAATHGDKAESFLWDGLALIRRDGTDYVNEPHAGGGAPVLAGDKVLFNDLLGSTLGAKDEKGFNAIQRTAFGETGSKSTDEFFTGKPMVGDLGYAFLFRNYRPEHGKWQTADLMGYPDGWNNLAYVNNGVTSAIDLFGAVIVNCLDANNYYLPVYTPSMLTIGYNCDPNGGKFSYPGAPTYQVDPLTKEVTFNFAVSLNMGWALKYESQLSSGWTFEYHPHESAENDAHASGAFYEVVFAHEMGHANAFFSSYISYFTSYMQGQNIDNGMRSAAEIEALIVDAVAYARSEFMAESLASANTGVYLYFTGKPQWKILPPTIGYPFRRQKE